MRINSIHKYTHKIQKNTNKKKQLISHKKFKMTVKELET